MKIKLHQKIFSLKSRHFVSIEQNFIVYFIFYFNVIATLLFQRCSECHNRLTANKFYVN